MHLRVMTTMAMLLGSSALWAGGSNEVASVTCGVSAAIEVGMTPADVKDNCGENWKPSYVSEHIRPRRDGEEDIFHKWLVHPAGLPETHVVFKNGEVVRIFTNNMTPLPGE